MSPTLAGIHHKLAALARPSNQAPHLWNIRFFDAAFVSHRRALTEKSWARPRGICARSRRSQTLRPTLLLRVAGRMLRGVTPWRQVNPPPPRNSQWGVFAKKWGRWRTGRARTGPVPALRGRGPVPAARAELEPAPHAGSISDISLTKVRS